MLSQINEKINNINNLYQKQMKYIIYNIKSSKVKLLNLCNLIRGYSKKSTKKDYRLIKISNIKKGKVIFLDKDEYVDKIDNKSVLNKDDFIISLIGSVGKIGL